MYMEDLCTIKKTDDGKFVVQVMPPRKKETKESKSGASAPAIMEEPKTYIANDVEELATMIKEHAGRGMKKSDDQQFEKGYKSK